MGLGIGFEVRVVLMVGTFLTFAQFLYVAVQTLHTQVYLKNGWPRWRRNQVPISRWMVQVILFLGVSLSEIE